MVRPPSASVPSSCSNVVTPLWADILFGDAATLAPGSRLELGSDWTWNPNLRYLMLDTVPSDPLDVSRLWAILPRAYVVDAEAIEGKRGGFALIAHTISPLAQTLATLSNAQNVPHLSNSDAIRVFGSTPILPFRHATMDARCFRFSAQQVGSIATSETCITQHESWNGAYTAMFAWRRSSKKIALDIAIVMDVAEQTQHAVFRPLAWDRQAASLEKRAPKAAALPRHLKLVR